jgi:non-ribosomal peptide synthase protein (TIGR01720 family)
MDVFSGEVLLQDFETAYRQISHGEAIQLPSKTTSVKQWSERLTRYAQSPDLRQELDYWLAQPWTQVPPLPVDYPDGKMNNTIASTRNVYLALSAEETTILLQDVPRLYDSQVMSALLMALTQAVTRWTGGDWLEATVIGLGRDVIPGAGDIDLLRTIGWLAMGGVLILKRPETHDPAEALQSIEAQLVHIPNRGYGYPLLVNLSGDKGIAEKLRPLRKDEINFNYLGRIDQSGSESSFRLAPESIGPSENMLNRRFNLVFVGVFIFGGQLMTNWQYSENVHKYATIEKVAQNFIEALRSLVTLCQASSNQKKD